MSVAGKVLIKNKFFNDQLSHKIEINTIGFRIKNATQYNFLFAQSNIATGS